MRSLRECERNPDRPVIRTDRTRFAQERRERVVVAQVGAPAAERVAVQPACDPDREEAAEDGESDPVGARQSRRQGGVLGIPRRQSLFSGPDVAIEAAAMIRRLKPARHASIAPTCTASAPLARFSG